MSNPIGGLVFCICAALIAAVPVRAQPVFEPAIVVNDIHGGDAYEDGLKQFNRE